jgi:hypothetical protein
MVKRIVLIGFPFLRNVEYQRVLAKMQRFADEGNDDVAIFVELADDMPAFWRLLDAGPGRTSAALPYPDSAPTRPAGCDRARSPEDARATAHLSLNVLLLCFLQCCRFERLCFQVATCRDQFGFTNSSTD